MIKTKKTWYLNFCASWHLTNNEKIFVGQIQPKVWDFTTNISQIIWFVDVGTINIFLANRSIIQYQKVTFVLEYKFNLILLRQIWENFITYYNNFLFMTLV